MFVKVTGTNLVRDTNSMGLSNVDQAAKDEYYNKVRMLKTQKDEINTVKAEIAGIKDDVNEIKHLMLKLFERNNV